MVKGWAYTPRWRLELVCMSGCSFCLPKLLHGKCDRDEGVKGQNEQYAPSPCWAVSESALRCCDLAVKKTEIYQFREVNLQNSEYEKYLKVKIGILLFITPAASLDRIAMIQEHGSGTVNMGHILDSASYIFSALASGTSSLRCEDATLLGTHQKWI